VTGRKLSPMIPDDEIVRREDSLRAWFTAGKGPVRATIDGLDIGWGGVQRWATSQLPSLDGKEHVDVACGYATFLAELGWRSPRARLTGLNIDFEGPHALAKPLLEKAGVTAELVKADARSMPFGDASFDSASCFVGLQDIEIAFGRSGVREALEETVRVLRPGGFLVLVDEYCFDDLDAFLRGLAVRFVERGERELNVRWGRETAERAVELYANGWVQQRRLGSSADLNEERDRIRSRLFEGMRNQLSRQGTYVPFGPMRMAVYAKTES
jgi:SAM-dependent methyltransferase